MTGILKRKRKILEGKKIIGPMRDRKRSERTTKIKRAREKTEREKEKIERPKSKIATLLPSNIYKSSIWIYILKTIIAIEKTSLKERKKLAKS